jgi:hypothetical protein
MGSKHDLKVLLDMASPMVSHGSVIYKHPLPTEAPAEKNGAMHRIHEFRSSPEVQRIEA